MGNTLYNLTQELETLETMVIEAFEERGGLSVDEETYIDQVINEIRSGSKEKLVGYAKVLLGMKARQEMVEAEYRRLRSKAEALKNAQSKLKSAVQFYMETAGLKKVEAGAFTFTVCKNGGKKPLLINCLPDALPEEYQLKTISANTDLLRKDIETGNCNIENVELRERGVHVRVK
jgi:hypothetical protein